MKTKISILLIISLLSIEYSFSQFILKEGYLSLFPKENAEKTFKYKNLILYPIIGGDLFTAKTAKTSNYLPLEEALKKKKVKIAENEEAGGEVNKLFIENTSQDTIYIMAGEVVKGGKQDRVISEDIVLEPKSGKKPIDVYCVEQSRWTYKSDHNFSQYHSLSTNSVRKSAAVTKDQGTVWQKVAEVTDKNKASTSTGTYTAISNSATFSSELTAYQDFFNKAFSELPNCVGFVGVSGDKIIGCDIFSDNVMFLKQLKNLLQSYCTEAITNGKEAIPSFDSVTTYLNAYLSEEEKQDENIEKVGKKYEYKGKKVHINTY